MRFCIILLIFLSSLSGKGQAVLKTSTPGWVVKEQVNSESKKDTVRSGGYYYLLLDRQYHYALKENFQHYAYKILTNEGLQQMSDLSVDFDPEFQKLSIHSIKIYREGTLIDKISSEIKIIQREQSMDRFLYDGTKTAVVNLKDVRIGDIVEYAYTIKGSNPIFKDHFSQYNYFDYSFPYQKLFLRLVLPIDKEFQLHYRNGEVKPFVKETDQYKEYSWTVNDAPAFLVDSNTPDWYYPYRYMAITDFKSWKEVNDWEQETFVVQQRELDELRKKLPKHLSEGTTEEKLLKSIRFVQDEIRYLGFENGIHSHKPHSPVQVLTQRFGDCKDKSLLLISIAKLIGADGAPVLVNTSMRDKITDDPPTTIAFDHCVAQISIQGKSLFIDPTINNQGGSLENIYFPTYSKGLIVSPGTVDLTDLNNPAVSETVEEQFFELGSVGSHATLKIHSNYLGKDADNQRSEFAGSDMASTQKSYLSFYGNLYPDITLNKDLKISDDREKNSFAVDEDYLINNFWKESEDVVNQLYCEFYPQSIQRLVNVNALTQRNAPYKLTYPLSFKQIIKIKLPESWNITLNNKSIQSDYYSFDHSISYIDNTVTLSYHYQTKQPEIPQDAMSQFVRDHEEMLDNLSFNLTYNKPGALAVNTSGSSILTYQIVLVFFSIAIGIVLLLRVNKYDPEGKIEAPNAQPIGGWLILISIGLCLSPVFILFQLLNKENNFFNTELWTTLWETRQYGIFAFISFELMYNIVLIFYAGILVQLFFHKRTSLPRLIQIFYAVSLVVTILDSVVATAIADGPVDPSYGDITRSIVVAFIWIPYFQQSERVKKTFLNRL